MPNNKKAALASTQKYLNILAIRDGMVVLNDGAIRMILEVGSLNFALKSEEEQNGIIYSYQQFLNSLKFPIQIVMQSRRLDLYGYLKMLRELLEKQTNDLIRIQTEEYINFIERLLTKANIMDKTFYVVVPFFPGGVQKSTVLDKVLGGGGSKTGEVHYTKEQFEEFKTELEERVNVISGGLGSMGLHVKPLDTQEIIELLYRMYNPAEAISERMTEVSNLESPIVKTDLPVQAMPLGQTENQPGGELKENNPTEDVKEILDDIPVVMNSTPSAVKIDNIPPTQSVYSIGNEIADQTQNQPMQNQAALGQEGFQAPVINDVSAPGIAMPTQENLAQAQIGVDNISMDPAANNVLPVDSISQSNQNYYNQQQSSQSGIDMNNYSQ